MTDTDQNRAERVRRHGDAAVTTMEGEIDAATTREGDQ